MHSYSGTEALFTSQVQLLLFSEDIEHAGITLFEFLNTVAVFKVTQNPFQVLSDPGRLFWNTLQKPGSFWQAAGQPGKQPRRCCRKLNGPSQTFPQSTWFQYFEQTIY